MVVEALFQEGKAFRRGLRAPLVGGFGQHLRLGVAVVGEQLHPLPLHHVAAIESFKEGIEAQGQLLADGAFASGDVFHHRDDFGGRRIQVPVHLADELLREGEAVGVACVTGVAAVAVRVAEQTCAGLRTVVVGNECIDGITESQSRYGSPLG